MQSLQASPGPRILRARLDEQTVPVFFRCYPTYGPSSGSEGVHEYQRSVLQAEGL